ncbi:MAG: hypothetical protein ACLP8S_11930 [Solirubrobacteraceae bacterium]
MPVPEWTHSISPPLERIGARRLLEVELLDVEGEDLAGAGGGLVEHPPQRLLPQRDVAARELTLDRSIREILRGVDVLLAALAAAGDAVTQTTPVAGLDGCDQIRSSVGERGYEHGCEHSSVSQEGIKVRQGRARGRR